MWKIGFLPHLSTSCPKVRELMMVPTYVAEITHGPRTFWKEMDEDIHSWSRKGLLTLEQSHWCCTERE